MLKKISINELRLGMHLHELCGAWLEHPFWKTRFVLTDATDLEKLGLSGIQECWIDCAKGLDVLTTAPIQTAAAPPVFPAPAIAEALAPTAAGPSELPTLCEEVRQAALLVNRSREAVKSLFSEARMGHALNAEKCMPLVADIAASVWRNPGALVSLARLKTHDNYSYMHSVAVCALMITLSRQLGHDEAQAREVGLAGLLHDMGKAVMPLAVLNKPGKLSADEYAVMKTHPVLGHKMLSEGHGTSAVVLDVCLHHHERVDGNGYPHGLSGEALSLHARMGAICDVYDAITSNRPYKAGWDPAESISLMSEWSKKGQFDAALFKSFVLSLGIYPNGSLVRLKSDRLGVVMEQNPQSLVNPTVKLFYATRTQMPMTPELLDLNRPGCKDSIVGRESNRHWKFTHLEELWAGREVLQSMGRA